MLVYEIAGFKSFMSQPSLQPTLRDFLRCLFVDRIDGVCRSDLLKILRVLRLREISTQPDQRKSTALTTVGVEEAFAKDNIGTGS